MEHVVFFPAPDGSPAFRRVGTLEDAVRLVEHLRNVEGVAEVSVHPLGAEVPLAFRAYYRVEVPGVEAAAPVQPAAEPVAVPAQPVAEHAPAEPVEVADVVAEPVAAAGEPVPGLQPEQPVAVSANGSAEGPKSLGFFAT